MDNEITNTLVPLSLGFIAYFVTHSLLASLWLKQKIQRHWPQVMPAYRLGFNFLSIVLLIPLIWMMQKDPGALLWQWTGLMAGLMNGLTITAILGFIWSLQSYDNSVFLGITQWRNRHTDSHDPESLRISTLHRFVRHPWYFFFLVIMWTQDIHSTQLLVYSLITLYLVIGSWMEERKLIAHYGTVYQDYTRQVPGLIPLPWRWLNKEEANRLEKYAADQNN